MGHGGQVTIANLSEENGLTMFSIDALLIFCFFLAPQTTTVQEGTTTMAAVPAAVPGAATTALEQMVLRFPKSPRALIIIPTDIGC